jgi:hypothetical protein
MKMTKAECQQWIDALLSGKYQQLRYAMYGVNGSYCCLGVCMRELKPEIAINDEREMVLTPTYPIEVELLSDEIQSQLIDLNDTKKANFPAIAEWLKINLLPLLD